MVNFSGFGDEAIAAFIVFILGVIFTIIWQKYTTKNRRIAYRVYISRPKIDIGEEISNRLSLSFDQQPVDTLHLYRITIENVGNLAVRNQHLLIKFDQDTVPISPAQFQHEPLVGPVNQISQEFDPYSIGYNIDLLAKGKKVEFRFFTKDNRTPKVNLYWRNDTDTETEVFEQPGQRLKAVDDHIQRLLVLLLVYLVVPPLINFLFILMYSPVETYSNFIPTVYVRDGIGALKGFILLLMYPSVKYLLVEWFRIRRQENSQSSSSVNIQNLTVDGSASFFVTDPSNPRS